MPALDEIERAHRDGAGRPLRTEIVRTSERLGPAAALNIGIRRASGPVVVVLDPAVELTGDIVTPLVRALDDPAVAVTGGWGSVTRDRRHFEDAPPGDVDVVDGALMAFRRADAAERGPLDERLRTEFYTAICWSLALRDGGSGGPHRRAVVAAGRARDPARGADRWRHPEDARLARDLKRDFYTLPGPVRLTRAISSAGGPSSAVSPSCRAPPNVSGGHRYRVRGLAIRFHRSPGGADLRGLVPCPRRDGRLSSVTPKRADRPTRPYTPRDAPARHLRCPARAAGRCDGSNAGSGC